MPHARRYGSIQKVYRFDLIVAYPALITDDTEKWARVIKFSGAKSD